MVREDRSLKSRCPQGHALSEGSWEALFLVTPCFRGSPAVLGVPRLTDASLRFLPLLSQGILPESVSLFIRIPVMDLEPTIIQYDLIFIYILITSAETQFLNKVIHKYRIFFGGDTTQSRTPRFSLSKMPRCSIITIINNNS